MKALAAVIVALAVCLGAFAEKAHAQRRLALLIGNATYNAKVGGTLKNPHNDAAAVGRALESVGFKITVVKDATRRDVLSEVRAFAERLAQEGPEAIGFFYYSGHGISRPEDRANYLIPAISETPKAPISGSTRSSSTTSWRSWKGWRRRRRISWCSTPAATS
jgi:Caspase domain